MDNRLLPGSRWYQTALIGLALSVGVFMSFAVEQSLWSSRLPGAGAEPGDSAGRYLVTIGGCNDCHTPGWADSNGRLPDQEWLIGSPLGWRGPWGTTYAANLRLLANEISEDAWVAMLKSRQDRPPMPWTNVNQLTESDSRAMYRFIRALGPAGTAMPAYSGPGQEPTTPYLLLQPTVPAAVTGLARAS